MLSPKKKQERAGGMASLSVPGESRAQRGKVSCPDRQGWSQGLFLESLDFPSPLERQASWLLHLSPQGIGDLSPSTISCCLHAFEEIARK